MRKNYFPLPFGKYQIQLDSMKRFFFVFCFIVATNALISQNDNTETWYLDHYAGTCVVDTMTKAVWLFVNPYQGYKYIECDKSFVIVEIIAANYSNSDIYLPGVGNKLKAKIFKESYVPDTARFNNSTLMWGSMPRKLQKESAYERGDVLLNPHKELWNRKNSDSYILIPKDTRKKLLVTIPKRKASYRVASEIRFNKDGYVIDCEGHKLAWYTTIESNKIELKKTY